MRTVRRLLVVIAVAASLCAVVWVPALAGPLRPPTGLSGRADSDTQVSLSWNAAGGATGYQVLRGAHSGGPYALVKTTTALSYSDGGLVPATTYYYVLRSTSGSRTSQACSATRSCARPATGPTSPSSAPPPRPPTPTRRSRPPPGTPTGSGASGPAPPATPRRSRCSPGGAPPRPCRPPPRRARTSSG